MVNIIYQCQKHSWAAPYVEFESGATVAEQMLVNVMCSGEHSVFRYALKVVMVAELFVTFDDDDACTAQEIVPRC